MSRILKKLAKRVAELKAQHDTPPPLIRHEAPTDDAEAVAVYAKARAGDKQAIAQVGELIRQRGWVEWVGDLGRQATQHLIAQATSEDEVWRAGIDEQVREMTGQLLGPSPTVLEQLLVRRIVNGWVAVHALELELSVRPPTSLRNKVYLDTAVSQAQKRMTQAVCELARLRRLQAPMIVAQLHLAPSADTPPDRVLATSEG